MDGTPSPLAQPTGLHCTRAGGWLSPSDPLQLLALITALCPHTVQMGPFVGLSVGRGREQAIQNLSSGYAQCLDPNRLQEEQASGEKVSVVVLREQKADRGHMVSTVSPSDSSSAHSNMASPGHAPLGQVHSVLGSLEGSPHGCTSTNYVDERQDIQEE
ncbi:hypothetical protein Baya_5590 [Bagarius yarrelli]|uniref:Uncharacterized protein n=1 Tax=Bagarius yarrelli TaxID=175774 RepID=A0A556TW83_BAGYA|nr:hypothetical protein Baya_5590 [Bagarius yarrelli]